MDKGIYCLVFFTRGCTARIGAVGEIAFAAGWYIYIGSALGSGGLRRLERHIGLAGKRDRRPKWHVDYILTDNRFLLKYAVSALTEHRLECGLARSLGGIGIAGFGCSDCSCATHLFYRDKDPLSGITDKFHDLDLEPVVQRLITRKR
jgi:Uri superfamily endonuclease